MALGLRKSFMILAPGSSLRRRVAYSLAIVRLVLVPVIFLAVYYLFKMGLIVYQIVNVDAPVTNLAEQISVQMSDPVVPSAIIYFFEIPNTLRRIKRPWCKCNRLRARLAAVLPVNRVLRQRCLRM